MLAGETTEPGFVAIPGRPFERRSTTAVMGRRRVRVRALVAGHERAPDLAWADRIAEALPDVTGVSGVGVRIDVVHEAQNTRNDASYYVTVRPVEEVIVN